MAKILVLSSNPRGDLKLNREIDDLTKAIERFGTLEVKCWLAVYPQEIQDRIAEYNPQIVHFCGHGAGERGLVFHNENDQEVFVSTEKLARIFKTFANTINCVILNACDSDHQAVVIVEHIDYVIGMRQKILDKAAYFFAVGFYFGLASGKSIEQAYEMGCIAIQIRTSDSSSTQSRESRKFEYDGDAQPQIAEYMKPVLRKKGVNLPSSSVPEYPSLSAPSAPPPGFAEFVQQESERKEYKDWAREAYDNFGQFSAQQATSLTKSEYEQRKILLGKVKSFWIEGFLQPSLQDNPAMRLDLKGRPDVIADLTQGIEALSVELDASYEELRETRIYEEMGQGRTLLILGEPGAGKTIALLQLAQRLIERSENPRLPMPVVFNLSSWAKERKKLVDWLIDELREKYQVPKSLSEPWITNHQLILLLDGLDEVKEDYRNDCVRALNDFIAVFPQTEIAVCSRVKDYEALTERLLLSSALCLQPLSSEQVHQFLDSVGGSLAGLKALLKNDAELEQFAQTPLILHFMSVAYQGWSAQELRAQLRTPERHQHLFDTYIDRRLERGATSEYSKYEVLRWLSWLAKQMSQSVFQIEEIQPQWLPSEKDKNIYFIVIGLILGVLLGLIAGIYLVYYYTISKEHRPIPGISILIKLIATGILSGLILGVSVRLLSLRANRVIKWIISGTIFAISLSFFYYFIYDKHIAILPIFMSALLGGGIFSSMNTEIKPVESIELDLNKLFRYVLFFGIIGMLYALIHLHIHPRNDYIYSIYEIIVFIIIGVCLGGFRLQSRINTNTAIPNQGIIKSLKYTVITFGFLLITAMFLCWIMDFSFEFNPVLIRIGLVGGLIGGLGANESSGVVCIQHFTLRQLLYQKGRIPWNYKKFLDFVSERRLMKKVGGGYVFFHRMLLEHFARMNPN
ncbi:NACHT domain-containing protein [Microcoleus sp. B4-C1]|uniref:NACHT domain-containing protein n=1 Tax=Microcoleus sp. B4-C1 TaxID=2818660 RepID=UPI002FD45699